MSHETRIMNSLRPWEYMLSLTEKKHKKERQDAQPITYYVVKIHKVAAVVARWISGGLQCDSGCVKSHLQLFIH